MHICTRGAYGIVSAYDERTPARRVEFDYSSATRLYYDIREKKNTGGISTTRISLAFYNTIEEVDKMAEALAKIRPEMGIV